MRPLGLSINALARALAVPANRVSGIVNGNRAISADTALRLGKYFGTSPEIWLDLQSDYELRVARQTTWTRVNRRCRPESRERVSALAGWTPPCRGLSRGTGRRQTLMDREFNVVVERDSEGFYVASVPTLHGCHTQARSLDELTERIKEAIALCLEVEGETGDSLDFVGVQRVRLAL